MPRLATGEVLGLRGMQGGVKPPRFSLGIWMGVLLMKLSSLRSLLSLLLLRDLVASWTVIFFDIIVVVFAFC